MAQRPPPFAALRALEAACRHRSYTGAAAELNVTHSAVSQAVRRLEEEVGSKLFHRRGSSMEPAAASLSLARAYADASQSVGRAMRDISESSPNALTLRAPAQLGRLWLMQTLPELAKRFPTISLCLCTEGTGEPQVDLSVHIGAPLQGHQSMVLSETVLQAYASPAFLKLHPLDSVAFVQSAPLLIERTGGDWAEWFMTAGLVLDSAPRGLRFDDSTGLAVEAAINGAGIALLDSLCARAAVGCGELVPVFADIFTPGPTVRASWSADHAKARMIEPLAAWLAEEARGSGAQNLPQSHPQVLARLSA